MSLLLRARGRAVLASLLLLVGAPLVPAAAQDGGWIESDRAGRVAKASLDETYYVDVRALNFREEATTESAALTLLQRGQFLRRLSETFNDVEGRTWLRVVDANGQEGWVAGEYVAPVAAAVTLLEGAAAFVGQVEGSELVAARPPLGTIKAGFVYVGPVGDAGWTYQHDKGRQALAELPFVESTEFVESVPEDPTLAEAAIERLIEAGSNVIFTTSYGYMDSTIAVARRHPEVVFMHCSGYKTAANVGTYFGREYEARYLSGLVAGSVTKANVIGYVAAFPIPEVIRGINAFTLGVRSVNPAAVVQVRWTSTWYGPGVERAQAEALLDAGADVLAHHQDTPATVQAAEQRGVRAIGYHSDMAVFAPSATLTSAVWDWGVLYRAIAEQLHEGSWRPDQLWWGLDRGAVGLAPLADDLPGPVVELVAARRQALMERRLHIFEGPVVDNQGVVRVPSGRIMADAELLTMDFFVEGVAGELEPTTELPPPEDGTAG
jgi:basic membrane protein A